MVFYLDNFNITQMINFLLIFNFVKMKYKAKLERLRQKQVWWDKLPQTVKNATTRPGGIGSK